MDEYLFAGVLTKQGEEAREGVIARKRTVPGYGHILHPQLVDSFTLSWAGAAQIHDDFDAHSCQGFEALYGRLPSAIKLGGYFAGIRNAIHRQALRERALRGAERGTRIWLLGDEAGKAQGRGEDRARRQSSGMPPESHAGNLVPPFENSD